MSIKKCNKNKGNKNNGLFLYDWDKSKSALVSVVVMKIQGSLKCHSQDDMIHFLNPHHFLNTQILG